MWDARQRWSTVTTVSGGGRSQERLSGRSSRKLGASARRIIFAVLQYFRGELHLELGQAFAAADQLYPRRVLA